MNKRRLKNIIKNLDKINKTTIFIVEDGGVKALIHSAFIRMQIKIIKRALWRGDNAKKNNKVKRVEGVQRLHP